MKKAPIIYALTALFALSACSTMQSNPTSKQAIVPASLKQTYDQLRLAPAVRAGDMLYLSGVVVEHRDGEDMTTSIARAFDEIEMILSEAGADWSDVVDVTSYLTDLDTQLGQLWQIKGDRVPAPYPAWTAIGISSLFDSEQAIIEIKVTAYLGE